MKRQLTNPNIKYKNKKIKKKEDIHWKVNLWVGLKIASIMNNLPSAPPMIFKQNNINEKINTKKRKNTLVKIKINILL